MLDIVLKLFQQQQGLRLATTLQSTLSQLYTVRGGVKIGNGVRIAAHCVIVPSNHIYSDPNEYIYKQGMSCKGITIEDDVWIGAGVKVLDGITIAKGCVIGANAVVSKSTEPYGIYVGVPAKKIKSRR